MLENTRGEIFSKKSIRKEPRLSIVRTSLADCGATSRQATQRQKRRNESHTNGLRIISNKPIKFADGESHHNRIRYFNRNMQNIIFRPSHGLTSNLSPDDELPQHKYTVDGKQWVCRKMLQIC